MSETDTAITPEATAGAVPDPAALMQALSGGNPIALVLSQLAGSSADNPGIALATQVLERLTAQPEAPPPAPDPQIIAANAALRERFRELCELAQRQQDELEVLRARNDAVAAALGACHLCFGADLLCEVCNGEGRSGWQAPDPGAYRDYVLPALLRIERMRQARAKQPGTRPAVRSGATQAGMFHAAAPEPV